MSDIVKDPKIGFTRVFEAIHDGLSSTTIDTYMSGSTLSCVFVSDDGLICSANVGDSRIYADQVQISMYIS